MPAVCLPRVRARPAVEGKKVSEAIERQTDNDNDKDRERFFKDSIFDSWVSSSITGGIAEQSKRLPRRN